MPHPCSGLSTALPLCIGLYPYTRDLLELEEHSGPINNLSGNGKLAPVITPLQTQNWAELLCKHPDQSFVDYILQGLQQGFHIGYKRGGRLLAASKNMLSALDHPEVVQKYLQDERQKGRVLGPFDLGELPGLHVSKFGVIPKSNQPGKWRLILDLSSPNGCSVNDGIEKEVCSLQYVKIDEVVEAILELGCGTELAKIDIKSTYRIVPVHPEDRPLLGMKWQDRIYVDATLPFGLRSAPKIFNALADAAQWIIQEMGARYLWHYLDDFITIGAAGQGECKFNCDVMKQACTLLGIPLASEKYAGPTCCLVTYPATALEGGADESCPPEEQLEMARDAFGQELSNIIRNEILCPGQLQENPADSCFQISQCNSHLPSNYYWITNNGTTVQVYCDMTRECSCNGTTFGGWSRVAYLDMRDPTQQCPPAWREITDPVRMCGRPMSLYRPHWVRVAVVQLLLVVMAKCV